MKEAVSIAHRCVVSDVRRTGELAAAIKATFEPVIHTHLFPRSQIDIFVTVEQQDGGEPYDGIRGAMLGPFHLLTNFVHFHADPGFLSCAINAVTLALLDAGIACSDYVLSLSVGLHLTRSTTLLDLTSQEEISLPHMVIATLPRTGKITLAQLETRIHASAIEEMMDTAIKGCSVLQDEFDTAMRQRTKKLAEAMGGRGQIEQDGQDAYHEGAMETD
jgi:exosome complex component RRP41